MKRLVLALAGAAALAQPPVFVRIPGQPYEIGRTEVTVRQFGEFVKASGYVTAAEKAAAPRTWKSPGYQVQAAQPVVYVTPRDAAAYCAWAGGRLPTDAEWEFAARAGATTTHYWGDQIDGRYLWYRPNSGGRPHAVGKKIPNAWGLYDVEGNVWEWTTAGEEKGEPMANRRGGSWVDCAYIEAPPGKESGLLIGISKYFKVPVNLDHRYDDIGFRCARDAVDPGSHRAGPR
jgi:formylglycine-generating enzyme required for sulfatase activity